MMRILDFFTSTKRPVSGTPECSPVEVRERLLELNRPTAPYQITAGNGAADLVAEWRIVGAQWYEIFAKAGLKKVFKISLRLDPAAKQVRALDQEYEVAWRAGVPNLSLAARRFRGQSQSIQVGAGYAFTEELRPGQVYNYRFATKELKQPLQEAVTACGWTFKGVAFGKL